MSHAGTSPSDAALRAFPALLSPGAIGRLDVKNRARSANVRGAPTGSSRSVDAVSPRRLQDALREGAMAADAL